MKIENAPALKIDAYLYRTTPMPVRVVRERRIAWNFLKHMEEHGFTPEKVNDYEESIRVHSKKEAMEILFNRDEAWIYFKPATFDKLYWVKFVLGNDIDIISDYQIALDATVSQFKPEAYA